MSNESNQVFSAPGIYYKTPNETKNEEDIVINSSDIDTLEADVLSITNDIIAILSDISTLQTDVSQLQLDVIQLETDVLQIPINTGNISTNVTDIGTNATDIKALEDSYEESKVGGNWVNGDSVVASFVFVTRYNNQCSIRIDNFSGTPTVAGATWSFSAAVGVNFRPVGTFFLPMRVFDNGAVQLLGLFSLDSAGNLVIFADIDATTTFTNATVSGSQNYSTSYNRFV